MTNILQSIPEVPVTNDSSELYAWIIGILIAFILGLLWKIKNTTDMYEEKLKTVYTRLDHVIDESIHRMERKEEISKSYTDKLSVLITKLHEILVIINR